jgi:glycosyltransferase involved in cell wall biosynthesis
MTFSAWLNKLLPTTFMPKRNGHQLFLKTEAKLLVGKKANVGMGRRHGVGNSSIFTFSAATPRKSVEVEQYQYRHKKLLKLSIITEFFPPDYAATGQLIEELVKNLEQQGISIEVFTGQPGYAFGVSTAPCVEQVGNIRIRRSRSARLWSGRVRGKAINGVLFTLRAIVHLVKNARRHDVFLLTSAPPFLPIVGYLVHLFFGVSYVCLIYDIYPDIAIALGVIPPKHWLARFWRTLNQKIWQKSQGIIVLSPAMKQRVIANCPEVADKVSVIHSWGDPDLIQAIAKQENWFAKKYNLVNKFTVLYSGNMGRCHDMDTIVHAAKLLQDEPIQFVFIGGGPKKEALIREVNRLGLSNFLFLPYQDKQVLPYSLTACDLSLVSVEPGMDSLVAPSKLYPALATGRPVAVVCSEYSYLKQLIADAECGASFENGDSQGLAEFILMLNSDRQLAERMGKASRQYLQSNFTPTIIAKEYLRVLRGAIS